MAEAAAIPEELNELSAKLDEIKHNLTEMLMAIPNLIALVALSGVVVAETKIYFDGLKK